VGLVLNANWAQMGDFMLGWVGIDFAGDDGRQLGAWPWQLDEAPVERPAVRPVERMTEEGVAAEAKKAADERRGRIERPTVRPKEERPKVRESVEPEPKPRRSPPPPPRPRQGLSPRLDDQP